MLTSASALAGDAPAVAPRRLLTVAAPPAAVAQAISDAEVLAAVAPVPCAARPSTRFAHHDGPCRCFFGGPPPEFAPTLPGRQTA